jgi:hypothetical protein
MSSIKNTTKSLVALGLLVFALIGSADARETPQKARLSAIHAQLTNMNYGLRKAYSNWQGRYNRAVNMHKHAVRTRQYPFANMYTRQANYAAGMMNRITQQIAQVDRATKLVERQLTALYNTPTHGNVVYDIHGHPIDQSWWMGSPSGNSTSSTGSTTRSTGSSNGLLLNVPVR